MRKLTGDLQLKLGECGDTHWADTTDLRALSEKLQLGILLFANNLQDDGTQCLVSLDQRRADFPYFVSIWWDDPIHFRVAELSTSEAGSFKCFWKATEIPPALVRHYNHCNPRAPVGAAPALEIS